MHSCSKEPLVVILGPTAAGKSKTAIEIALKIDGEIVSADSMLIYKKMNIGTAKPSFREIKSVPHHMIDLIEPFETYSVAQYQIKAKEVIREIHFKGKIPILAGGTGLYINSVIYSMNFADAGYDPTIRSKMHEEIKMCGEKHLYEKLLSIDAERARLINPNDTKRIIRALEVYYISGKTMSELIQMNYKNESEYNLVLIGITMDRAKLYNTIEKRADKMFADGFIDEVAGLREIGCDETMQSMQGLGYKQVLAYLNGDTSLDATIEIVKRNTKRYAKRQLTWFRQNNLIHWIHREDHNEWEVLVSKAMNIINQAFTSNQ